MDDILSKLEEGILYNYIFYCEKCKLQFYKIDLGKKSNRCNKCLSFSSLLNDVINNYFIKQ